jgi:hypothetical protein
MPEKNDVRGEAAMSWLTQARQRARTRLALAEQRGTPPPFAADTALQPSDRIVVVDAAPTVDEGIPRGVRIAGAWAWRVVLFIAAAYLLLRLIGVLRIVVIPVVVALLVAALFEPAAAALRRRGLNRSLAAGLVLIGGLVIVGGGLGLIIRTFVGQFDDLSAQVGQGIDEVKSWLSDGPLHLSQAQLTPACSGCSNS